MCVSFLIFSPHFSASQKSVIFKNVDSRASLLKHDLNKNGDTLLLKSESTIFDIEIFNENFSDRISVKGFSAKVPLQKIPIGRYISLVRLENKLIAFSLVRKDTIDVEYSKSNVINKFLDTYTTSNASLPKNLNFESKTLDEKRTKELALAQYILSKLRLIKYITVNKDAETSSLTNDIDSSTIGESAIAAKKNPKLINRTIKGYWVVKVTRGQVGSKTERKMATKKEVDALIIYNKKEQKTKAGRFNVLNIWEVYNIDEFKRLNALDKDFVYTSKSDCFNNTPIFSTKLNSQ